MLQSGDAVFGVLDFPGDNQVIQAPLRVSGWTLSRIPNPHEIHLEIDGESVQARIQRIPRPDVFRVHPHLASNNPTPGFHAEIDANNLTDGEHTLACIATVGKNAVIIAQIRVRVAERGTPTDTRDLLEEDTARVSMAGNPELAGILTNPSRVLLMHIPKTAGTSLNDYIRAHFQRHKTTLHAESLILGKKGKNIRGLERKHFISAHLNLDTLRKFVNVRRYFMTTMFRDPTQQTLSHLAWVKRLGDPDHHKELSSLPDYIKRIAERINTLDLVEFFDTLTIGEKNLFDNCQTRYLLPFQGDVDLTEPYLHAALLELNSFDAIGLTERYDDSIMLLAFFLGWQPPRRRRALNVSDRKYFINLEKASDAVLEGFNRITRFDNLLYANAATIFERQVRNMLAVLCKEYPEWAKRIDPEASALQHLNLEKLLERRVSKKSG